jgi:4a-hydroxytetrahydrobiopterin dehydratase
MNLTNAQTGNWRRISRSSPLSSSDHPSTLSLSIFSEQHMRLAHLNQLGLYSARIITGRSCSTRGFHSSSLRILQKHEQLHVVTSMASSSSSAAAGDKDLKGACIPCSSLDPSHLLSPEEVQKRLDASLPMWQLATSEKGPFLRRKFTAKSFQAALDSVNAMGAIAERENHHPDFHMTDYRDVEVVLWTHKLNGITESDLTLAAMLNSEVTVVYSPKWLREHPEAQAEIN